MLMKTEEDDLRVFSKESPNMKKKEKPFNMSGKPIVNSNSPSERGMLDGQVNTASDRSGNQSARTVD